MTEVRADTNKRKRKAAKKIDTEIGLALYVTPTIHRVVVSFYDDAINKLGIVPGETKVRLHGSNSEGLWLAINDGGVLVTKQGGKNCKALISVASKTEMEIPVEAKGNIIVPVTVEGNEIWLGTDIFADATTPDTSRSPSKRTDFKHRRRAPTLDDFQSALDDVNAIAESFGVTLAIDEDGKVAGSMNFKTNR